MTHTPSRFIFIIGSPKCGTTSLFHYLSQHPEVCPASRKEPFFFSDLDRFPEKVDAYLDLWDWESSEHRVALEASTMYTRRPYTPALLDGGNPRYESAAERIEAFLQEHEAEGSFVYLIRDPLERIESYISSEWNSRHGPSLHDDIQLNARAIFASCYQQQLRPFERCFDKLRVIDNLDLQESPRKTLRDLCSFAGIDPEPVPEIDLERRNVTTQKYKPGKIWSLLFEAGLGDYLVELPTPVKDLLRPLFGQEIDQKYKLSEQEEIFLRRVLGREIEALAETYGLEPDRWDRWSSVPNGE